MKNRIKTKMIKILSGTRETRVTVQVADTQRKREKGLMFVGKLPGNEGMLFVFSEKNIWWLLDEKHINSFIYCFS
ncbi:DUF192 domain-containing protein [Peribacillus frigoritolerans]|uniref:DUF192 domain-containing protein n=1 Tax=Peribacillus frigoritolerans TaxID=450367 RepID=UPI00345C8924